MAPADPGVLLRLLLAGVVGGELFPGGGAVCAGHVGLGGESLSGLLVRAPRVVGAGGS